MPSVYYTFHHDFGMNFFYLFKKKPKTCHTTLHSVLLAAVSPILSSSMPTACHQDAMWSGRTYSAKVCWSDPRCLHNSCLAQQGISQTPSGYLCAERAQDYKIGSVYTSSGILLGTEKRKPRWPTPKTAQVDRRWWDRTLTSEISLPHSNPQTQPNQDKTPARPKSGVVLLHDGQGH